MDLNSSKKAFAINHEGKHYGVFAEIGAGQEVARQFFLAGMASKTVAKTMSAYDMTFSDAIYGKGTRYVAEDRVVKMLDHEYSLLKERLHDQRGDKSCFFVFADTVATNSNGTSHGWMGVRFQTKPNGPVNDVIMHVELLDKNRLQQQHALGHLGLNLIYAAFYHLDSPDKFIQSLTDEVSSRRAQIDLIRFQGTDVAHIDNRVMALKLVQNKLTHAVVFDPTGNVVLPQDFFYKRAILVQRGAFRPITAVNLTILERAFEQFKKTTKCEQPEQALGILEITMNSLSEDGSVVEKDFLDRIDLISALNHSAMISDFAYFYELKEFLRRRTDNFVSMVVGASTLGKIFDPSFYKDHQGGILNAFGRLFDDRTRMLVFPYKSTETCLTAKNFHPGNKMEHLYKHLTTNELIEDVLNCDDVDTSIHSSDVRKMLAEKNPAWEKWVPKAARMLIQKNKLFGFNG